MKYSQSNHPMMPKNKLIKRDEERRKMLEEREENVCESHG